ncbi:MAG: hypothetical protein O3A20_10050 [Planctomycetota bacterium]|nr:hypothetical protein [Planctomycetota bacterium]
MSGDAPLANDLGSCSLRASILEPEGTPQILAMLGQQKEYLDVGGDRSAAFHLTRTGTLVVEWLVPTTQERDGVLHSFKRLQPCVSIPVGPGDDGRVIEIPPPQFD